VKLLDWLIAKCCCCKLPKHKTRTCDIVSVLLSTCIPLPSWTKLRLTVTLDLQLYSAMAPSLSSTWPTRSSRPQHDGRMASTSSLVPLETPPPICQDGQDWARFT
jgi:hypothetical protein